MMTSEMTDNERTALERANGKRITFHTRHHWILTWLEEQPGKNLAEKTWNTIMRAYRADYAERGRQARRRYWDAANAPHSGGEYGEYTVSDYAAMSAALCAACECFGRAGMQKEEEWARQLLGDVLLAQAKHVA